MNESKIGTIKEADLILKGAEKEAYLEFVEHGGFASMKEEMLSEIEWKRMCLREDTKELQTYKNIKKAIESVNNGSDIDKRGENLNNKTGSGNFSKTLDDLLELGHLWSDASGSEQTAYYFRIFYEFYKYLLHHKPISEFEAEFKKEYELLHKNLEEDTRLMKLEYETKIDKYKNKVKKSTIRKILAYLKIVK